MTVKRNAEKVPTNALFLTFNTPEMPKEITVKVALFAPNPMRCFNCNKFGHTSRRCKVAAKCHWCGKDKSMKVSVRDPSCALIAMVPMPQRVKTARSGRRRKNSASPR